MNAKIKGRILSFPVLLVCFGVVLAGCGLNDNQSAVLDEPPEAYQSENLLEENDAPISGENGESSSELDQSPIEPEFGSDSLPCPGNGATMYLGFDHALTVNYEDTSINHFLHQGYLQLQVTDDGGTITSADSPSLTYTMEGKMSDECVLTGEGSMIPTANGRCEAGVVSLLIDEDWMARSGGMQCVDSDGDIVILPFNVPPMGLQQHHGQDGQGEIFYLVEGAEGYATMRPFLEGEGYHTWTLYTEDIPLVPLVP